jgi:hypothetical protein
MIYLFCESNNGYYSTYQPFICNKILTQDIAYKLQEIASKGKSKMDGSLHMMIDVGGEHGYDIKPYYCMYKKHINVDNFYMSREMLEDQIRIIESLKYDYLPNDFNDCPIIYGACGNY